MSQPPVRAILLEAAGVACLGAMIGLAANFVSPRGLALSRDYFPSGRASSTATPAAANPTTASLTNSAAGTNSLTQRLEEKGLQHVDTTEATALFRDPRYEQSQVLFIDARDDEHYSAGHIPGAHQFFHYRPEKYAETVLPLAQAAQQVVIYCNGGDCEDSEFAAIMLRDMGVPASNLYVYLGGFSEWSTNNLPVEVGERLSGDVRNTQPGNGNQ